MNVELVENREILIACIGIGLYLFFWLVDKIKNR